MSEPIYLPRIDKVSAGYRWQLSRQIDNVSTIFHVGTTEKTILACNFAMSDFAREAGIKITPRDVRDALKK